MDEEMVTTEESTETVPETAEQERHENQMLQELHEQVLGLRELIGEVKGAVELVVEMGGRTEQPEPEPEPYNPLIDPAGAINLDLN